ncbi:MAG TPA: hypothetical protein VF898_10195 [Chloroflexota bacterium]
MSALLMLISLGTLPGSAQAAGSGHGQITIFRLAAPPGLALSASPSLVDVGDAVTFTLTARAWTGNAGAVLSFVSPHHGFTGNMTWVPQCSCFSIAVALAKRIHTIELAQATATVHFPGGSSKVYTRFQIRGLASNGKSLAPGGTPGLTAWVSDPSPSPKEYEHFCGWVKTPDGIGVRGYRISFVAHYGQKTQQWVAGTTDTTGILCSQRSIGTPTPGLTVRVDVYANNLRAHVQFVPRSS